MNTHTYISFRTIGYFMSGDDKLLISVYKEGNKLPHFHVKDTTTGTDYAILFGRAQHISESHLSEEKAKELDCYLRSWHADSNTICTVWRYAIYSWNELNPVNKIDPNVIAMPNYSNILQSSCCT